MAVTTGPGTMSGGVTPTCDDCGVSLCWDVSRTDYIEAKAFWDAWRCRDCAPEPLSAHHWRTENGREALPAPVESVVAAFEASHADLADGGLTDDPGSVRDAFEAALAEAGIAAETVVAADVRGRPHRATAVGDFTVDWDAARHDADAPCPLVYRTSLGWPVVPESVQDVLARLAEEDPAALDALFARLAARRAQKAAA